MLSVLRTSMVLAGLVALLASNGFAQGDEEPQAGADAPAAAPSQTAPPRAPDQAGPGQPPVVVAATDDKATVMVVLRDVKTPPLPIKADFSTGLVTNDQQAALFSRPEIVSFNATLRDGSTRDFQVELGIKGLFAFGESSVPLFYRGTLVETLRFARPGMILKATGDAGFVAREGSKLTLVLENPSAFGYKSVRARLRFADTDQCAFKAEVFPGGNAPGNTVMTKADAKGGASAPASVKPADDRPSAAACNALENWTAFEIPRYAQVTLRTDPPNGWFRDPATRFARAGKKKGLLTLRFQADGVIHEQNLPLEVQFDPSGWSLFSSLLWVAVYLIAGALLSLVLRVSVPNIKRKRQLKDQLDEAANQTASISTEVDSNLRVLLRVERLALDEVRLAVWPFGPGFADYAQRVEQGLPTLKRRIDAVRRLDAALMRKKLMAEQGAAPTRLAQIESQLDAVSETLKQDQLSDEDWVFVNQRLEAAQKTLREPTQTEKEAFDAMLAGRWKAIREHFGVDDSTDALKVPPALLQGMKDCFPDSSLLPAKKDEDGSKWIQAVGAVRADLQLSALSLVSDFQFLAPAGDVTGTRWENPMHRLNELLATPTVDNLNEARSLLRQLAEDVSEVNIVAALNAGNAMIIIDPALPRPNQKIRFSVRFREDHLNSAAAKYLVRCHWTFSDRHASGLRGGRPRPLLELNEDGWYVHHYFEGDVEHSTTTVSFFDSKGTLVDLGVPDNPATPHWSRLNEPVRQSGRSKEKWGRAWLELFQLSAALLIPLATLASTTISGGGSGHWWELVAIGFGSDTIKSILVGRQESSPSP